MKKLLAFTAVLFLASAAIPKEPIGRKTQALSKIPVTEINETKEAYSRLASSMDTLFINFSKKP